MIKNKKWILDYTIKNGSPDYTAYICSWCSGAFDTFTEEESEEEIYNTMINIIDNVIKFKVRNTIHTGKELHKEIVNGVLKIWNLTNTNVIMEIRVKKKFINQ